MISGSYEFLASEYYEPRHITSRNFDAATSEYLRRTACDMPPRGWVLDLGAGMGAATKYCGISASRIIQSDIALHMLRLEPRGKSAARVQADALALPFKDQSFAAVTAFLFDPFNSPPLYQEIFRVLSSRGRFLGTLPHPDWGFTLRNLRGYQINRSRFLTRTGEIIDRPSLLMTQSEIAELLDSAGFTNIRIHSIKLHSDNDAVSPDIADPAFILNTTPYELPILFAIQATKC